MSLQIPLPAFHAIVTLAFAAILTLSYPLHTEFDISIERVLFESISARGGMLPIAKLNSIECFVIFVS
jgi:hypothetical protein